MGISKWVWIVLHWCNAWETEIRASQDNGRTSGTIGNRRNVGGSNVSEESCPSFLDCKGNGGHLQDSVNVTLQQHRAHFWMCFLSRLLERLIEKGMFLPSLPATHKVNGETSKKSEFSVRWGLPLMTHLMTVLGACQNCCC